MSDDRNESPGARIEQSWVEVREHSTEVTVIRKDPTGYRGSVALTDAQARKVRDRINEWLREEACDE